MTQVRTALRAYLFDGYSAADCLDRLDRLMDGLLDQHTATAVIAIVNASTGHVEIASAGHLPPVLVDETGTRQVAVKPRPLLGVGSGTASMTEMELPAGARLLLYTDGLIERRRVHLDESIEHLLAAAGDDTGEDSLAGWVNRLLTAVPGGGDDDTTVLALRLARATVAPR
jgi:serine phosphatase RsbU (regulator of sigma subunit)